MLPEAMLASLPLALALAAPPCGLPPLPVGAAPWAPGETLTYDLDLLGAVKAGTLQLSVERPISGGQILTLRARARSEVGSLMRLAGVALSWIDARTLLPERYREEAEQDGVHKLGDVRLAPPAPEVTIAYTVDGKTSSASYPREGDVLDALSAVYRLRAAKLAPGDRFCFDLVARGRYWRLEATVAPKAEKVDTAVGRLETLRVDALAHKAGDGKPPTPVHLWISTDPARLLVAVVTEIDAGPVRAMLASARGTRR